MADIAKNIENIKIRIQEAAQSSPYNERVKLIAVTKYQTDEDANEAIRCGITDIGENHVQALMKKQNTLLPCRKHFIGHLQTNKIKHLLSVRDLVLIHSVDSLHLAEELEKQASAMDKDIEILLQVNVSGEETKFGMKETEVVPILNNISRFEHLTVKGFMSIMPVITNPDYYKRMRYIFDNSAQLNENISILSMGMSGDFEMAIENGANMVRIGSLLFI